MKERWDTADGDVAFDSDAPLGLSTPKAAESTFRLNTWTVPLSLETASHCAVEEKARL